MKKQIRFGVFETNSSSQHTLTIMSEEEFKEYTQNSYNLEMYWDRYNEKYISKEELIKEFNIKISYLPNEIRKLRKFDKYTDEQKIDFMLENYAFYNDEGECAEVITKEINMPDGTKSYAISRYTWED